MAGPDLSKIPPEVLRNARRLAIEGYPVYTGGYRVTKLGKILFFSPEKPISKGRLGKAYSIVAFPSSPKDEAAFREASAGVLGGGPATANRGGIGTMRELAEISDSLNARLWIPERVSSRGLLRTRHMTGTNIVSVGKALVKTAKWCKKRGRKVEASMGIVTIHPSLRPKAGRHRAI